MVVSSWSSLNSEEQQSPLATLSVLQTDGQRFSASKPDKIDSYSLSTTSESTMAERTDLVSNEPSQRIEFSVVWRPKVPVKKDLMIDELDLQRNLDVELSFLLHHPTLFNKCPPEKQHKLQKLMSMAFASNSSTTTDFDKSG